MDIAFDRERDEFLYRPLCKRKGFDDFALYDRIRPYLTAKDREQYRLRWTPIPCSPCRGGKKGIVLGDVVDTSFGDGAAFNDKAVAILTPHVKWCCEFLPLDVKGADSPYFILTEFCESTHLVDTARTVVNEFYSRFELFFVCDEQEIPSFFMLDTTMFVKEDLWDEIIKSEITGLQATKVKATFNVS